MGDPMRVPDFTTDAEAAKWYAQHQDTLNDVAAAALASGKAKRRSQVMRERESEEAGTVPVTIRLSAIDVERAREQAGKKGLRYQTYIKMLLHQALSP